MSWDNITGEAKILPSVGNSNEVIFENGKAKKIRLLLEPGEQPYSYLEHAIEADVIENGQVVHKFRTVRCPKTTKNPNAPCPLCDGQRYKRRARNAANVWDFDAAQVRKLNQGDSVWKPIGVIRKMGIDVCTLDFAIMKTGEGRNNTEYSTTNLGASAFTLPENTQKYNIEEEYRPATVDEMKATIEEMGLSWQEACTPPTLQFPSLQDALAHVMPNGKYKGQTMQQIWDADHSARGMINFLATKSNSITEEKAAAQVILVNLGGANIPGVPKNGATGVMQGSQVTPQTAPQVQTAPAVTPAVQTAPVTTSPVATAPVQVAQTQATTAQPVGQTKQAKIDAINTALATEKYVKAGFQVIMDTLKRCGNGKTNIGDFSDAELDTMLAEVTKA